MKTEFNKIKKHDNLWIFITNIVPIHKVQIFTT